MIALTGVILIWSHELNLRGYRVLPAAPTSDAGSLTTEPIAALLEEHPGSRVMAVLLPRRTDTAHAWHVYLRRDGEAGNVVGELDGRTGQRLGTKSADRSWQHWLLQAHYELLLGTPGAIVAWGVSLASVVMALTGFWLYRSKWRELFRGPPLRGGVRQTTAWLHRWLGVWSFALALLWGVTGFIYMWLIVPGRFAERERPMPAGAEAYRRVTDLPGILARAAAVFPDAEPTSFRIVGAAQGTPRVTVRALHRERWFWEKVSQVTLEGVTGQVLQVRAPGEGAPRERLSAILAALHFGSQGSRFQQVLWTVGGIAVLILPLSGYAVLLLRRRGASQRSLPGPGSPSLSPTT